MNPEQRVDEAVQKKVLGYEKDIHNLVFMAE